MLFKTSLSILVFAVAAFAQPFRRGAPQVVSDIDNMKQSVQALDNAIVAFPDSGATLDNAMAIHQAAENLKNSLQAATSDATNGGPFTDAQTDLVIEAATQNQGETYKALDDLVDKKPAMQDLSSVIVNDLENLNTGFKVFSAAIQDDAPADKKVPLQTITDDILEHISAAIAAFSP